MKQLLLVSMFVVGACGGGSKKTTTTASDQSTSVSNTDPNQPPPAAGDGVPCEQEIALQCPEDQIDACLKTPRESAVHECVAK